MSPALDRIGTTLGGKYKLESILAAGGMGTVYRATHRNQGEFAVKVLNADLAAYPDMRARFVREGYAANSVRHRGVVAVVDDDVAEDGSVFMVMELLRGSDVERLGELRGGRLEVPLALAVIDELLDVLAAAHEKGIVHRDVKPANLFLTTDGVVKVLDFGIARAGAAVAWGATDETRTGVLLGTPAFMAPEQARGASNEIDATTDLWAVGATLFAMLSGATVHEAESACGMVMLTGTTPARSLARVAPEVADEIVRVVDRALAFERSERWESANAMRSALRDAAARAGIRRLSRSGLAAAVGGGPSTASFSENVEAPVPDGACDVSALTEYAGSASQAQRPRRSLAVPIAIAAVLACAALTARVAHQPPAHRIQSTATDAQAAPLATALDAHRDGSRIVTPAAPVPLVVRPAAPTEPSGAAHRPLVPAGRPTPPARVVSGRATAVAPPSSANLRLAVTSASRATTQRPIDEEDPYEFESR